MNSPFASLLAVITILDQMVASPMKPPSFRVIDETVFSFLSGEAAERLIKRLQDDRILSPNSLIPSDLSGLAGQDLLARLKTWWPPETLPDSSAEAVWLHVFPYFDRPSPSLSILLELSIVVDASIVERLDCISPYQWTRLLEKKYDLSSPMARNKLLLNDLQAQIPLELIQDCSIYWMDSSIQWFVQRQVELFPPMDPRAYQAYQACALAVTEFLQLQARPELTPRWSQILRFAIDLRMITFSTNKLLALRLIKIQALNNFPTNWAEVMVWTQLFGLESISTDLSSALSELRDHLWIYFLRLEQSSTRLRWRTLISLANGVQLIELSPIKRTVMTEIRDYLLSAEFIQQWTNP